MTPTPSSTTWPETYASQAHPPKATEAMRTFTTGATRGDDTEKLDFEGCLSPRVLTRFAEYMREHQTQADGQLRSSDNWQKGIPKDAYMKSLLRHVIDVWTHHRDGAASDKALEDALCACLFNVQGYLHAVLTEKTQR